MQIKVSCYAGSRAEETPRQLTINGKSFEVIQVLNRWLEPDYRFFKVRTRGQDQYSLRYREKDDRWELLT